MHDRLLGVLDTADEVIARSLGIVPEGALAGAAGIVARLRRRVDFPDDLAVVALAGGTGSGKSSLFNALLDTDRAEVGGIRPTTERPLVSVPERRRREIESYVDWADTSDVSSHEDPATIVLIDMPDTDSVETGHRATVEGLLPTVDAVLWVVDVEKYRDDSLHSGFLTGAAAHEARFLFALNQIDRLDEDDTDGVVADFEAALIEDGFTRPAIFPLAARPPVGPPVDLEPVRDALAGLAGGSMRAKFAADLAEAIAAVAALVGKSGTDFEDRWETMRPSIASAAVRGEVLAAGRDAAGFFADLAATLPEVPASVAMELSAKVGERLRSFVRRSVAEHPAAKRSILSTRTAADDELLDRRAMFVSGLLDDYVGERLRPMLRERAEVVAGLGALSAALTAWRSDLTR